jgi:hypothetical protein
MNVVITCKDGKMECELYIQIFNYMHKHSCGYLIWTKYDLKILSHVCVTIDGVLDWILDLLTTYTHSS